MSKITCICGNVIADQSDSIKWKARFIADQDYDDFLDVIDEPDSIEKRTVLHKVFHEIFQCSNCSSLIVFRNNQRQGVFFQPIDLGISKEIFRSSYELEWKGFLSANFTNEKSEIFWYTNIESGFRHSLKLDELRDLYTEKFAYLSKLKVLKTSFLRINGELEHEFIYR